MAAAAIEAALATTAAAAAIAAADVPTWPFGLVPLLLLLAPICFKFKFYLGH